jgi:hypothetical protein
MTLVLPTAPFDPLKTIFGSKVIVVFTPSSGTAFNVAGKAGDFIYKQTTVERHVPGTDVVLRADRQCIKDAEEKFEVVDIEEIDDVLTNFGSFTANHKFGTAVIWIMDQDDPAGTSVRLKSRSFKCSVTVKSGTTKFGGGDFAKTTIVFFSTDPAGISFTPNATS